MTEKYDVPEDVQEDMQEYAQEGVSFGEKYGKIIVIVGIVLLILAAIGFFVLNGKSRKAPPIIVDNKEKVVKEESEAFVLKDGMSPISGVECDNWNRRPMAVMYSGSEDVRPYRKNLDKADLVLEMPHRMHDEPRLMGIFQCATPDVLGPMRSGRVDHIAVADSFGAVFVTWGKSITAASVMRRGFVDNLEVGNGTKSKDGTRAGFIDPAIHFASANSAYADLNGILKIAEDKRYSLKNTFKGFPHQVEATLNNRPDYGLIEVKFDKKRHRVVYKYDKQSNSYKRFYGTVPSVDSVTGEQYAPKNLITIVTKRDSWLAEKDYVAEGLVDPWAGVPKKKIESNQYPNMQLGDPWFDVKFDGPAKFFINGQKIDGKWKRKKGEKEQFEFYDNNGKLIRFVPGQIWMHVLPHGHKVTYKDAPEVQ